MAGQNLAIQENMQKIGHALVSATPNFAVLLPKGMEAGRFVRIVQDQLRRNRELFECTPNSLIDACSKAAADGLVLDGREAALVIYNKGNMVNGKWEIIAREAQYIPMVAGLRRRIWNSGQVASLHCGVVYQAEYDAGAFDYQEGTQPHLIHKPILVGQLGPPVLAYSVVTMVSGHRSVEVMRWTEIMAIARRQAKNVAKYEDKKKGVAPGDLVGVWASDLTEMAKKTVLRRHSKQLPFDSETARMFGRVDDLYRNEGEEIDHDPEEGGEDAPPAPPRKQAGAGAAKLREARQRPAEQEQQRSAPAVEDADVVGHDPETGEVSQGDYPDDVI